MHQSGPAKISAFRRATRWITALLFAFIAVRVLFYFVAKLYFGSNFNSTDIVVGAFGLLAVFVTYTYFKILLGKTPKITRYD